MGVLGVSGIAFLSRIDRRHEATRLEFVARTRLIESLRSNVYLSGTHIRDFLLESGAGGSTKESAYLAAKARAQEALGHYRLKLEPQETASFLTLEQAVNSYFRTLDQVLEWPSAERRKKADVFTQSYVLPLRASTLVLLDHVEQLNRRWLEANGRATSDLLTLFRKRLLWLVALMLGLGSLLAGVSLWRMLELEKESGARFAEITRAKQELSNLSARVLETQEIERRRIARELHDEVGQSLWAMGLEIDNLAAAVKDRDNERVLRRLEALREISNSSVRVVRNMSLLLRPSMLDDLGLVPALEWLAREVSRTSGLHVEVTEEQVPDLLPEEHKTCVFRVVQEALRNTCRHAGARNSRILVQAARGELLLSVQDDGCGFDPARKKGLGLLGMEERAGHLGGTCAIDSKPGCGTIIRLQLPLAEHAA
ncbi:MAG: sensor histidine kinase [Bryobacteraceae bacterium]|nr:sensor histidine kinase [Bryobacteraceae bacterium]